MVDERLYRLRSKDGSHFNEKTNEEGWNSAVQFDEENNLQGPLEYQVVDESEYTQVVEVERKQRTCYLSYPNASTRVAKTVLSRDGYDFPTYFITFKLLR